MTPPSQQIDYDAIIRNPFQRLRELLGDAPPGIEPAIDMTIGAPRHDPPGFAAEILARHHEEYRKYPPARGVPELRQAIADWAARRYQRPGLYDPEKHILPLCGSREGLFSAMFPAKMRRQDIPDPAALIPNPFYQAYAAAALSAGAEPVYLPCTRETGYLPDLDALAANEAVLKRTIAFFLCSPSNPQGAVASKGYLQKAIGLARAYDFMLFADECYSEIYYESAPAGIAETALTMDGGLKNILSFNSLSKRSNLPGLRSGFCAGDEEFIERYGNFRNVACPQMPLPIQWASREIWSDEEHVTANRNLYKEKLEIFCKMLPDDTIYNKPEGGFFIWINLNRFGKTLSITETLWKGCGVKVLPGAFLAQETSGTPNPAKSDIRIALVHDLKTTQEALERIIAELF